MVELVTELTHQLEAQQARPQEDTALREVVDAIAFLEDGGETEDRWPWVTAMWTELKEEAPSLFEEMISLDPPEFGPTERALLVALRPRALKRLRAERETLQRQHVERPSAWDMVANANRYPQLFDWMHDEARKRFRGLSGAPGGSIRRRALGRAIEAAVSRHSTQVTL